MANVTKLCTLLAAWLGLALVLVTTTAGVSQTPRSAPLEPDQALAHCAQFKELFADIGPELSRWKQDGITLELMQQTIAEHTTLKRGQKGFAGGFWKGKAYLLDQPQLKFVGHHAQLLFIYMRLLVHLENTFRMPDVDFVINTIDRPLGLQINPTSSDPPVLRFCKTNSHSDIMIPIFHFHMKDYDGGILAKVPKINETYPWETKKDVLFGRFSLYARHFHTNDPAVPPRLGEGGQSICESSPGVTVCDVRKHFVDYSSKHKADLDISNGRRIKMPDHAKYKYLVHLDGQGLSSRLDQLLPLNSLVVKEESGYKGFYHHLIKPYEHYVPFWKERPEDVLEVLNWARQNDAEARRIAANGQRLALKYLNKDARSCYWYMLLVELSKLLRYTPGKVDGREHMQYYQPVDEYLQTIAKVHEGGRAYRSFVKKFTP